MIWMVLLLIAFGRTGDRWQQTIIIIDMEIVSAKAGGAYQSSLCSTWLKINLEWIFINK